MKIHNLHVFAVFSAKVPVGLIVTENDDTYRIAALPPGLYEIAVSKDGDLQFDGSTKK